MHSSVAGSFDAVPVLDVLPLISEELTEYRSSILLPRVYYEFTKKNNPIPSAMKITLICL